MPDFELTAQEFRPSPVFHKPTKKLKIERPKEIRISMDGRGRCRDNAKMERFWWALKYEDLKIKEYVSLPQLRFGVQHYANFYNAQRIHSALDYKTADEVYFGTCHSANTGHSKSKRFTPSF